jgi:hypothetical protein
LHDKISKAKQAAAAGAAVAKGVATGMQAATVNIGQSLMAAAKGSDGEPPSGLLAQPAVKAAGGVGMEILRVRLLVVCACEGGGGLFQAPLRARTTRHKLLTPFALQPTPSPNNKQKDIAAVRDAMVNSVATAWTGLKDATVEVRCLSRRCVCTAWCTNTL